MKSKYILLILIFTIILTGISAVNASNEDNITISTNFNDNISFIDENVLSKTYSLNGGSFEDIQDIVDKANSGDTITLKGTYKAKDSSSLIRINKKLNIESTTGAILNANSKSGIFYLDKNAKNSVITGLTFTNGKRTIASAIYIDATNITINKCTFKNNKGTDNGGGAVATTYTLNGAKSLTISNCIFTNNRAPASSAALAAFSTDFKIINTTFTNNIVTNNMGRSAVGGALIAGINQKGTYGLISGCTFKNNKAITNNKEASRGGAAGIQDNTIIENCKFISNTADNGGALHIYGTATIKYTNFTSNTAENGGCIYAPNKGKTTITNSNFNKNTAQKNGGSIFSENNTIIINNSKFTNNGANNGGTIYSTYTLTINNSNFSKNTADNNGGALYISKQKTTTIINSYFNNNTANNNGGAISQNSNNALKIENTAFNNNTATNGGAIRTTYTLTLTNTKFQLNSAITNGGAIHTTDNTKIIQSNFTNNVAQYGGSIFCTNILTIENSKYMENKAINGSAIYNTNNLTITNTTFKDNQAQSFQLKSQNYTTTQGKNIKIKVYLEYGDNYPGIYTQKETIKINNKTLQLTSGTPNQEIILTINNKNYTQKTNTQGYAIFNIPTKQLKIKKYTTTFTHENSTITTQIQNQYQLTIEKNQKQTAKSKKQPKSKVMKKPKKVKQKSLKKTKQKVIKTNKYKKTTKKTLTKNSGKNKNKKISKKTKKTNKKIKLKNPGFRAHPPIHFIHSTLGNAYNTINDVWNIKLFTIPGYEKTMKNWGTAGKVISFSLDFLIGLKSDGSMCLGDAAINALSLIGVGVLLRGSGIAMRGMQFLTKAGRLKKIYPLLKNSKSIKSLKYALNIVKNNKFVKPISNFIKNNKIFKKISGKLKNINHKIKTVKNKITQKIKNLKTTMHKGYKKIIHIKNNLKTITKEFNKNLKNRLFKYKTLKKIPEKIKKIYKVLNPISNGIGWLTNPNKKIISKIITNRLNKYIKNKNIIIKTQRKFNIILRAKKAKKIANSVKFYFNNPFKVMKNIIHPDTKKIKKNIKTGIQYTKKIFQHSSLKRKIVKKRTIRKIFRRTINYRPQKSYTRRIIKKINIRQKANSLTKRIKKLKFW